MTWRATQLTFGTAEGRMHAHSYYDIPVWDDAGRRVLAHRLAFTGRHPTPEDAVEVGVVDAETPGSWRRLGDSRAWSWQQGPMAQMVPGTSLACWNDRGPDGFVARLTDLEDGGARTLPRPVYALDPHGRFVLSLDMGRLDRLRPGYGYPVRAEATLPKRPEDAGIWRMDLQGGAPRLILSLRAASDFLFGQLSVPRRLALRLRGHHYWFNHAKIAPDGARFTVKLRWRRPGGPWTNDQGVSLTARCDDGGDLRLLADATSHVIWRDDRHAYLWRAGELALFEDAAPRGRRMERIGAGVIEANVHARHLPPGPTDAPSHIVFDTPYREEVALRRLDCADGSVETLASFTGHTPPRGPFRCDLHPVPDPAGRRILVTSPMDGGRQLYLVEPAP